MINVKVNYMDCLTAKHCKIFNSFNINVTITCTYTCTSVSAFKRSICGKSIYCPDEVFQCNSMHYVVINCTHTCMYDCSVVVTVHLVVMSYKYPFMYMYMYIYSDLLSGN